MVFLINGNIYCDGELLKTWKFQRFINNVAAATESLSPEEHVLLYYFNFIFNGYAYNIGNNMFARIFISIWIHSQKHTNKW